MHPGWIFVLGVAVQGLLPLALALPRVPYRSLLLHTHLAATLTLGGLLGAVYVLPLGGVDVLAGQVSYAGFLFASLVLVVVARDVRALRGVLALTVAVDVLVYASFHLAGAALGSPGAANTFGTSPALFEQSLRVVVSGGLLILLELALLLAVLEAAKRRVRHHAVMVPVYLLAFAGVLALDGVLFPALVLLPPPSQLGGLVVAGLETKLVLAAAYAVPLLVFVVLFRGTLSAYEATPFHLRELLGRDELRGRAARADATLENVLASARNTMLVTTDDDFRITLFNAGAENVLGWTAQEVLGRDPSFAITAEELARRAGEIGVEADLRAVVEVLLERGEAQDVTLLRRDGTTREVSITLSRIVADGRPVGFLAAGEDVTPRVRAEAALSAALSHEREARQRMADADRVKHDLVSTVSHELRTPLAGISGYAELLETGDLGPLSEEQGDAVRRIRRNTRRLHSLVDDLLLLARARSGQPAAPLRLIDLRWVVDEAREPMEELVGTSSMRLVVEVPDGSVPVQGDQEALERVLLGLVGNAVKHAVTGRVGVVVGRDGDDALLSVVDEGPGIAEADQAHVFTAFYRGSDALARAVQGSGLGLSVVSTIVARHLGRVSLDSTPGGGTTVTVRLPLQTASPADAT